MLISKHIAIVAAGLAVLFGTQTTIAQSSVWTGGGGTDNKFTQVANWNAGVPGPSGTAFFSLGSTYDVFVNEDVTTSRLNVSGGDIDFIGGNELLFTELASIRLDARVAFEENDTRCIVNGGNFSLSNESVLSIRDGAYLEVKNSAEDGTISLTNDTGLFISNATAKADRIRSGFGSTTPTGYIQLDSGSRLSTLDARIGQIPGSDCGLFVFGEGTEWLSDEFLVGVFGSGNAILQNGGVVDTITTKLACIEGATGEIQIIAEGSKWTANQVSLGSSGEGLLQLIGGGDFLARDIVVGEFASGSGAINIQDAGSDLTVTATLTIGGLGTGSYSQTNGSANVTELTTIGQGSTFTISNATFNSGGLENRGTMEFTSGFANLQTDVSVPTGGGDVQVTTSPVNFLQDLRHNGSEMFIAAGDRVNVFGDYTGNGEITGDGVIHFKGDIDPGVNANPALFGTIFSEGDVVIENTARLNVLLDGNGVNDGDLVVAMGTIDLQSPQLNVSAVNVNQIQDGDEFLILKNDSGMTGSFQGYAEGAVVAQIGNVNFAITYSGGNGSDVVLIAEVVVDSFEIAASSFSTFRGVQIGGNLASIQSGDDARLRYNPGFVLNTNEAPIWVTFDATIPTDSPTDLKIFYEANANTPGLTITVEAFNWNTNSFDVLDSFDASFNADENVGIVISGHPEYVEAGSGDVRARIGWRKTGFTIVFPWEVGIDWMGWSGG